MTDKKTFGQFIKEKRICKNYSQKDLAELLYVTESAVSKWERGVTYPDITLISNICKVLENLKISKIYRSVIFLLNILNHPLKL